MDDQDVSEDAWKNQEPKQNSLYSEDLGHGIFHCMATLRCSQVQAFIETNT